MDWYFQYDFGVLMVENLVCLIVEFLYYEIVINVWCGCWFDMFEGYVFGMLVLMVQLEEVCVLFYGLFNILDEVVQEMFDVFLMIKLLCDVVVFGVEKVVKLDLKIYEIVFVCMGDFDFGYVLFIDDCENNCVVVEVFGFKVYYFQGVVGFELCLIVEGFFQVVIDVIIFFQCF